MENQIRLKAPKVRIFLNGNLELLADWPVRYNGYAFTVPAGFISDGNSVPWLFRRMVPKFGKNTLSGIVHDWLYFSPRVQLTDAVDGSVTLTRKQADVIRNDIGLWCGVGWIEALAGYVGLRIGGGPAWRYHRQCEKLSRRGAAKHSHLNGKDLYETQKQNVDHGRDPGHRPDGRADGRVYWRDSATEGAAAGDR